MDASAAAFGVDSDGYFGASKLIVDGVALVV